MIKKPKFMNDKSLYIYTEEGVVLTEKGKADKKVAAEYNEFIKNLKKYR